MGWLCCIGLLPPLAHMAAASKPTIAAYTYRGDDTRNPVQFFSPHDTISLRVRLKALTGGHYQLQAEWIDPFQKTVETTDHFFEAAARDTEHAADFSLSLLKAGFFARMLSAADAEGFNARCFGRWRVRIYLNGEEIVYKDFEIR